MAKLSFKYSVSTARCFGNVIEVEDVDVLVNECPASNYYVGNMLIRSFLVLGVLFRRRIIRTVLSNCLKQNFRTTFVWSDDEEETKRVVRSAKDKRYGGMRDIIKNVKNHKKIKDMANILSGRR